MILNQNNNMVSPFNAARLPGIQRWFRSDQLVTAPGNVLTVWGDSLGSGDTLVPFATGPAYTASDPVYNNLPSFTAGAASGLTSTLNVAYGTYTVFVCGVLDGAHLGYIYTHNDNVSFSDFFTGGTTFSSGNARAAASCFFTMPAGWATGAVPKVFTQRFEGTQGSHIVRRNGSPISIVNSVAGDPGCVPLNSLFQLFGGAGGSNQSSGSFAEVIICAGALSDQLTIQTENYLISRYNAR